MVENGKAALQDEPVKTACVFTPGTEVGLEVVPGPGIVVMSFTMMELGITPVRVFPIKSVLAER